MNKRIVSFTSVLIILFSVATLYKATVEVALGYPATTIFVNPPTNTAGAGQTFFIDIKISDVIDLYGWEFNLTWNPNLLDVVNVTEGNFLKQGGSTFFTKKIDNTKGYILVDGTLLGNVSGVSGSGTLATVKFYAEIKGQTLLDLHDTILIDSHEIAITHTATDGTVTVSNPVGGISIPINKLELLAPYIGLTTLLAVAVVTAVFFKHKKEIACGEKKET